MDSITITCTFADISAPIKVHRDGGMRITLDIPEDEMGEAVKLLALRDVVLSVSVEPERST
jgi:hypothetical protein